MDKSAPVSARVSVVKSRRGVKTHRTEGKAGLGPGVPFGTPHWSPVRHEARPTTTDLQSRQTYLPCTIRKDSRDTRSQPEFFNHLKRSRKTIFLNATPIRRDGRARTNRGNGFSPGLREQSPASPGPRVREQRQPRRAAIRLGYLTEKEQRGHTLRLPAFW